MSCEMGVMKKRKNSRTATELMTLKIQITGKSMSHPDK